MGASRTAGPRWGRILILLVVVGSAVALVVSISRTDTKAHLLAAVESTVPEDASHVAVLVSWTNIGTKPETDHCEIQVTDQGGSLIGDMVDGPANPVLPEQTVVTRSIVKTDVDSASVGLAMTTACHQV